jgi:hypothetical protein
MRGEAAAPSDSGEVRVATGDVRDSRMVGPNQPRSVARIKPTAQVVGRR